MGDDVVYLPLASVMARPAEWETATGPVPAAVSAAELDALRERLTNPDGARA